ncbi:hypothetical protein [Aquibacillus sediminis]|uniref:hypothetical protein n=1 Tax=Aquibacillus sediminis TaxID=2574734 RepID=UPI001107C240|nr:hypothetical protein [Aquibacillus sediminis]
MPDNHAIYSKMIGKLLGDGSITKQQGRKPRFQFTHTKSDYAWTEYCYQELKDVIPLTEPKLRRIKDARMKKGFTESYFVLSKTYPIITELESIWYMTRKKTIPFSFLEQYFDQRSLAWWFQDDGSLKTDSISNVPRKIILSTDSFSKGENKALIAMLKEKYNLHFSLDKQNRLVIYHASQIYYFLHLVQPYMHPAMIRKTIRYYPILCNSKIRLSTFQKAYLFRNLPKQLMNN